MRLWMPVRMQTTVLGRLNGNPEAWLGHVLPISRTKNEVWYEKDQARDEDQQDRDQSDRDEQRN